LRIRRRNLRKGLVAVGCLVASVEPVGVAAAGGLLTAGSLLHFWSKGCLEQNQKLVTAGPYRFTRNPFYLANLLIDLGLCALIGRTWVAVPYVVLWGFAYHDTIRREETRLAELFPGELAGYVAAVPRLIPTGRMLPAGQAMGRFTLANPALAAGSEYARILGVWVAAATIVAWHWMRGQGLEIFAAENTAGLGLVALVPVAWVAKLALAEVFRRPQTALLPFSGLPMRRRPLTFLLVIGIYFAAAASSPGRSSLAGSIAMGLLFAALVALPLARESHAMRGLLHAGLAVALGVFATSREILWLASGAILWIGLAALDDAALARLDSGKDSSNVAPEERVLWPMFGPVAILTAVAATGLAVLRRLA